MEKMRFDPPKAVADRLIFETYKKNETILAQGDNPGGVCVLLEGSVKVMSASPAGTEYVTHYTEAVGFFGDVESLTDRLIDNTIVAGTACKVARLEKEAFLQWLRLDWDFLNAYLDASARRLIDTNERAKRRYIYTVDENIWQLIRQKAAAGEPVFEKSVIEKAVFSTGRSINRSLKKFSDAGAIEVKKGVIRILDPRKADDVLKSPAG